MAAPLSAVANTNDPFGGGFYGRAAVPTGVNGAIAFPGTPASRPPDVQPSNILTARTDRQTNEKLPYARVSQIIRSDDAKRRIETTDGREDFVTPDKNLTSGVLAFTYSPKEKGQKHDDSNREAYKSSLAAFGTKSKYTQSPNDAANGAPLPGLAVLPNNTLAPARGFNQERMQLMAAVDWVESFVLSRFVDVGNKKIDLLNLPCTDDKGLANMFKDALTWSPNVLRVPDIAKMYSKTPLAFNAQGLFVMEEGPFLRSYNAENHDPIDIEVPGYEKTTGPDARAYQADGTDTVDRHVGSQIAHDALYRALEEMGVLDWKPDGIVLSRLATGPDQEQDDIFDLQNGALINMAIAGPAITSSWTNKPKMLCLPMDKVFVVVVADLSYKVQANVLDATLRSANRACDALTKAEVESQGTSTASESTYLDNLGNTAHAIAIEVQGGDPDGLEALKKLVEPLDPTNVLGTESATELKAWLDAQLALRSGEASCTHATLSSFRLMRVTSSFLTNTSRFVPGQPESRCGLKIGAKVGADIVIGASEMILGGWCIGTVMDAAASRAAIGLNRVHSARSTMAMSVSVNVAWWSADDLYAHYMDKTMIPPGESTITSYKTSVGSIASRPSGVKSADEPKALAIHTDQNKLPSVLPNVRIDARSEAREKVDAPAAGGGRGAVSAAVAPASTVRPAASGAGTSRPTRPL